MSENKLAPTPWSRFTPIRQWVFELFWLLLCRWTPKPFNFLRLMVLRLFGCRIKGRPFVHSRAYFTHPWKVTLAHRACVGDRAHLYALGPIYIGEYTTIAQEAYVCAGTHDLKDAGLPLICDPITVGSHVFVGARAFVLPGLTIGDHAIVGAAAVVTKSVEPRKTVAGNPAKVLAGNLGA